MGYRHLAAVTHRLPPPPGSAEHGTLRKGSRAKAAWTASQLGQPAAPGRWSEPIDVQTVFCLAASRGGTGTGSDQAARQSNQAAALIFGSDRNAQEVFDAGFLEMSYQNAELPKLGGETCAAAVAMAREYEVGHGR
jgi:hypothetical protein